MHWSDDDWRKQSGVESLTEIIDVEVLQEIQDKFAVATGLAAVIADKDGTSITQPSCFSRLCRLIRSTPEGLAGCKKSDAKLGLEASQTQEPVMSHCHAGLVDLAAPIVVNGRYLGSVLCGQIFMEESTEAQKEEISSYLKKLNLDSYNVDEMVEEISIMPKEKFQAAADLLQIMARYIVSIGISSLNEKLINQKNIALMKEEASRARLENDLKTMELKALQAQVNPHFLFNTLNTIVRLAMIEGAEETEKVAYALSHLLRYTLRLIEQEVTLQDEIEHVKEYLIIQQYRYGDRLSFSVELPENTTGLRLPIMTLQPLVENAIVHGLEPKIEGGTIIIKAEKVQSGIKILVEDDGVGLTEDRMLEIRKLQAPKTGLGHTTGIGFINVIKRLQHYFGPEFSYDITSRVSKGTRILLNCPFKEEVEKYVQIHGSRR